MGESDRKSARRPVPGGAVRPYSPPRLLVYGAVSSLTAAGTSATNEGKMDPGGTMA